MKYPDGDRWEVRAAAKAGRRLVRERLPAGFARWVKEAAEAAPDAEEAWALAGLLTAMAETLREAFGHSGQLVRDRVWELHRMLQGGGEAPGSPPSMADRYVPPKAPELEPFEIWLAGRLGDEDGAELRRVVYQWIETANERLTLRRYHRRDQRARHGRVLVLEPVRWAWGRSRPKARESDRGAAQGAAGGAAPGAGANAGEEAWAEAVMRFIDLVEAERQGARGRDRITPVESDAEIGGFYGVSEEVQPPKPEAIEDALQRFEQEMKAARAAAGGDEARRIEARIAAEMLTAVAQRRERGEWPDEFRFDRGGGAGLMRWLKRMAGNG